MNKLITGLFIGRFQPLTIGHTKVIDEALKNCDVLVLCIGSSQKELDERNPFNATLRALLINKVYEKEILTGKLALAFIPDREFPKDDLEWGKYLLNEVKRQTGKDIDIVFEGSENVRDYWFNENVKRFILSKQELDIDASRVRNFIITNNYEEYKKFVPKAISYKKYFNLLSNILKKIEG